MNRGDDWEIYKIIVHDVGRYRDWPIRILTFTSALHFALLAAITIKEVDLNTGVSALISCALLIVYVSTIYHFGHCHKEYLRLRNVQVNLNKALSLDRDLYPKKWFSERPVTLREGLWGWGFYAIYATVLFFLSLIVIWQFGFQWS
jgi:hypothetical protein